MFSNADKRLGEGLNFDFVNKRIQLSLMFFTINASDI